MYFIRRAIKEDALALHNAHIFGLYLSPNALGLGIGKELLNLMIEEAKK